jgi:hypothetical protein
MGVSAPNSLKNLCCVFFEHFFSVHFPTQHQLCEGPGKFSEIIRGLFSTPFFVIKQNSDQKKIFQ